MEYIEQKFKAFAAYTWNLKALPHIVEHVRLYYNIQKKVSFGFIHTININLHLLTQILEA
jgi:hypothetical protein